MTDFHTNADADAYKTLQSLIKYNNGLFKSQAQAAFIASGKFISVRTKHVNTSKYTPSYYDLQNDPNAKETPLETKEQAYENRLAELKTFFNIEIAKGLHAIDIEGTVSFANYGSRGNRRVGWVYVFDNDGLVEQYRLHYKYNGGCSSVNKETTELIWKRPVYAQPTNFKSAEQVEEEKQAALKLKYADKKHIGSVKEKITITATVKSVTYLGIKDIGYTSVSSYKTVLEDEEGNVLIYWNELGIEGKKYQLKATVKLHTEYNGLKQTIIQRPKITEII